MHGERGGISLDAGPMENIPTAHTCNVHDGCIRYAKWEQDAVRAIPTMLNNVVCVLGMMVIRREKGDTGIGIKEIGRLNRSSQDEAKSPVIETIVTILGVNALI